MKNCKDCMKTYVVKTESRRINIRLVFWGLAIVTDWERDEWHEALLIALFPYSKLQSGIAYSHEYPYLTRHLWGNWWWIDREAKRWLRVEFPFVNSREHKGRFVQIPKGEYDDLKYHAEGRCLDIQIYVGSAYQEIIDGLSNVEGKTMDREAIIEHLKSHKQSYTDAMCADWLKFHGKGK